MTTSASAVDSLMMPVTQAGRELPRAGNVLVVTARPGQESADLGGLLYAFRRAGASLALLCLTRGEASPLNSTWCRAAGSHPALGTAACRQCPGHLRGHGGQLPRWRTPQPSGSRSHPARPARDPPVLRGPAAGHRPGGGRPRRHSRRPGRVRCRQAGGCPGRGAHRAGRSRDLDDRSGRRRRHRPRHPEIRRGRAPEPVRCTPRADTAPGPARWPGSTALACTSVLRVRARQDDPGYGGVCLTGGRAGQQPPSTEQDHGLRGRSRLGQNQWPTPHRPCVVTCGIPTPPAELRLNAVLSRREPGIVPLPGMRPKTTPVMSRRTPCHLHATCTGSLLHSSYRLPASRKGPERA